MCIRDRCQCGHSPTNATTDLLLTLRMPPVDARAGSPALSLLGMLDAYCADEPLQEDYDCAHCRRKVLGAVRRLQLTVFSEVLIIRLGLDSQLGHKDQRPVSFLHEYRFTNQGTHVQHHFHLHAVVAHIGPSLRAGHYKAYICKDDAWWEVDDQQVVRTSWERVQQVPAYILFYKR